MRTISTLVLGALLAVAAVGCQKDNNGMHGDRHSEGMHGSSSSDPKMMKNDACPACPGMQTARADGTCPQCGGKVKS